MFFFFFFSGLFLVQKLENATGPSSSSISCERKGEKYPWSEAKRASLQECQACWSAACLHVAPASSPLSREDVCTQLIVLFYFTLHLRVTT